MSMAIHMQDIANIIKNSSNLELIDFSKNGCKFYKNTDGNNKLVIRITSK